jgi:hypothetical protein
MALGVDRLEIGLGRLASSRSRDNVIDLACRTDPTACLALLALAQVPVTLEYGEA